MTERPQSERFPQLLLRIVDAIVALLVFVLPFVMGGREAWGHWLVISSAFALGTVWAAFATLTGARWRISWLEIFLLAGAAIVWFQLQPQSAETMQRFSAEYTNLTPHWAAATGQEETARWTTLSFTPDETQHGLWMFVAYCVIFLVVFQRLRQPDDCYRLLKGIAISGTAMTCFALVQWAASNGKFFWFYEHPFTDTTVHLKGAFTNRNHFAQFATLCWPPMFWWLCRTIRGITAQQPTPPKTRRGSRAAMSMPVSFEQLTSRQIMALAVGAIVVVLGAASILLSQSRGGIIAGFAAGLIATCGLLKGIKSGSAVAGIVLGGGLLFFSVLAFAPQEELQARIDQLLSGDADQIDAGSNRRAVWKADAEVIRRFPLLGTGVGSHRDVYTLYMEDYADHATHLLTHAESSFVNVALEAGLIGVGLLSVALLWLLLRLVVGCFGKASADAKACTVVVFACAVGGSLHAVVDFIWYSPAIVVTSLMLAAIGLKTASRRFGAVNEPQGIWFPRPAWAVLGGLCIIGLVSTQAESFRRIDAQRHWYAALSLKPKIEYDESDDELAQLDAGDVLEIDDQPLSEEEQAAYDARREQLVHEALGRFFNEKTALLARSLAAKPNQHRVQLVLAETLLKYFDHIQQDSESRMPLLMIRDAALASEFPTSAELKNWCKVAVGDRIKLVQLADVLARRSLQACPIQGHAYLSLVETNFLRDPANKMHGPLIEQALTVRGYDPAVRYIAGREAMLKANENQDVVKSLEHWKAVFHVNSAFRLKIVSQLAGGTSAAFFLQHFEPDFDELRDLKLVYESLERERDVRMILNRMCQVPSEEFDSIEEDEDRLRAHLDLYLAARQLERLDDAVAFLQKTIVEFPYEFEPRYQLGMTLVELEQPDAAMEHLEWCMDSDPGHIFVPQLIRRARKLKIKGPEALTAADRIRLAGFEQQASDQSE